jgi:PAS domain S-box-containing protein
MQSLETWVKKDESGGLDTGPHGGSNTVLAVDDTPDRLQMMTTLLRQAGYRVLTARDGREGFEVARRERPDLVVSDVAMPRADGIELCRMLRKHEELGVTPVLLVSALRKDTAAIVEGLQSGAFDYLEAPFDPGHLLAKVGRLVEMSETERTLRETEERYRDMVENARDIIYTHDLDGRFTSLNKAGERITGYTRDEAAKMNITDIVAPECLQRAGQMLSATIKGGGLAIYDMVVVAKGGRRVPLEINSRPVYKSGELVGAQGIARDVTERKRAEAALREREGQLRQVQKLEAVGQLAGGIAHDFNNLLTVINGYADLMLRGFAGDDPMRSKTEEIKKAAERATSLTRQLLAFSRKQILQPRLLDLNSLVAGICKMLRRLIGEDIEMVTVLRPDGGRINADPGQIEQVVMNLVVNAKDAMPHGGKITIETASVEISDDYAYTHVALRPGRYVRLAVSDTGVGMDAETRARIFEPFFTTKEVGKGTGLGLSTVYGIVKQSGGDIEVYSEVNTGTTFKVYLPLADEEAEREEPPAAPGELLKGTETILLVEDEGMVRTLARAILQESGYKVLEAVNGEEALRLLAESGGPVHLVLTDVVMPLMSGRELVGRVTALSPATRALYMSGYTDEAIVHHGVLDPDTPFLEKPFTPDALLRKVRETLGQSP